MKFMLLSLILIFAGLDKGWAAETSPGSTGGKTITIDIPSDLPAPPSAEETVPLHPFFDATSTGGEAMEHIHTLEERLEKLEKKVEALEKGKSS
jgi:hypothetical protein